MCNCLRAKLSAIYGLCNDNCHLSRMCMCIFFVLNHYKDDLTIAYVQQLTGTTWCHIRHGPCSENCHQSRICVCIFFNLSLIIEFEDNLTIALKQLLTDTSHCDKRMNYVVTIVISPVCVSASSLVINLTIAHMQLLTDTPHCDIRHKLCTDNCHQPRMCYASAYSLSLI